jgi:hypothetical protein
MPILQPIFYETTGVTKTNQYIETGCYRGDGVNRVKSHYDQVHSIELSEVWYKHCAERFKDEPNIHIHFGNSKYVLPELLATIQEPVTVYLDGHFSAGDTAFGEEQKNGVSSAPLLTELAILQARPFNDIIIVDDCRMLGQRAWINPGAPATAMWPEYEYDWTDITEEAIRNLMKPGYILLKQDHTGQYTDGPIDQWMLVHSSFVA